MKLWIDDEMAPKFQLLREDAVANDVDGEEDENKVCVDEIGNGRNTNGYGERKNSFEGQL